MSTTTRTKAIVSVVLTVSLALNFYFLGWLAGTSPFVPGGNGGPFGRDGGLFNPAERNERAPEIWFVDFLTMGMSKDGRDQVMQAVETLDPEIRNLKKQGDTIKKEAVSLLLADKPDTPRITESVRELEAVMQRRLAAMHEALIPVVSRLGADDRRIFATRWEVGPRNGPPPPRPPR